MSQWYRRVTDCTKAVKEVKRGAALAGSQFIRENDVVQGECVNKSDLALCLWY